ncbi:MAG TPA: RAMP superfamily CRISPR-associated protein, partial [Pirellulales bacterium]
RDEHMKRILYPRFVAAGWLTADAPLAIDGPRGEPALPSDAHGRIVWPAGDLIAELRAWCERFLDPALVSALWDSSNSGLLVDDAEIRVPRGMNLESRPARRIDRRTGASVASHVRTLLPRSTRLGLRIVLAPSDDPAQNAQMQAGLALLLQALADGEIRLGRGRSRGCGRVRLEYWQTVEERIDSADGLLDLLGRRRRGDRIVSLDKLRSAAPQVQAQPSPVVEIDVHWLQTGALLVQSDRAGLGVDVLPASTTVERRTALVLPGTSVKGSLRAQAEKIVRTLLGGPEGSEQLPLCRALFGSASEDRSGRGALEVDDVASRRTLSRDQWASVEQLAAEAAPANDPSRSPLRKKLTGMGLDAWRPNAMLALDRWSGGASENAPNVLEPQQIEWEPLRLRLDLGRVPQSERAAAVALVFLTLHDLGAGRATFGSGSARGRGVVQIEALTIRNLAALGSSLASVDPTLHVPGGRTTDLPAGVREALRSAWSAWLASRPAPVVEASHG